MKLVLARDPGSRHDSSSFRDNVRDGVFGAQLDGIGARQLLDHRDGDTTECMIQRYRVEGTTRVPLGAPCPTR